MLIFREGKKKLPSEVINFVSINGVAFPRKKKLWLQVFTLKSKNDMTSECSVP